MARPPSTHRKQRLTIELAIPVRERLDDLKERTGAESVTEVIRRALAVYDTILTISSNREDRLLLRNQRGEERILLIPRDIV
jgi:hypothetical protein